jgi:alpha-beta hydrolase superfamily lysophospholipase
MEGRSGGLSPARGIIRLFLVFNLYNERVFAVKLAREVLMSRRQDSVRLPLPAGGAIQAYVSYEDPHRNWAVVYVHGFGSTRMGVKALAMEMACSRRGWTFASFDFRGHGDSTGTLLELRGSGLLEDLELVRDYLIGRGIPHFCPIGSSMGGWAAAWFTLRNPSSVPGCALIAPAVDFLRSRWALLTEDERAQWKRSGRLRVQSEWVDTELGYCLVEEIDLFPMERLAAELDRPVLIFHGLRDDVVPLAHSMSLLERAAFPRMELRLYKDGDHRLMAYKDEMAEAACEFFSRCLTTEPAAPEQRRSGSVA